MRIPTASLLALALTCAPLSGGVESLLFGAPTALSTPGAQGFALLLPGSTGAFTVYPALTAPQGWGAASYGQFFRNNTAAGPLGGVQGNGAFSAEVPLDGERWGLGVHWQWNSFDDDARDSIAGVTGNFKAFDSLLQLTLRGAFFIGPKAKNSRRVDPRTALAELDGGLGIKLLLSDWGQKISGVSSGDTKVLAVLVDGGLAFTLGKFLRTALSLRNLDLQVALSNVVFSVPLDVNAGIAFALPTGKWETHVGLGWESTIGHRNELSLGASVFAPLAAKDGAFTWRRLGATLQARVDFDAPQRGLGFGGGFEADLGVEAIRMRLSWGLGYQQSAGIQQTFAIACVWKESHVR
jgi:hypothetical protein